MATKTRIHAEERRQQIIDAAKPLFANNGFNGTSIRDIAKAADVSNALLYKHFPSKEAMYEEILKYTDWLFPKVLRAMERLEPSTEALIFIFYTIYRVILFDVSENSSTQRQHERLLFYSFLENIDYAQKHLNTLYKTAEDVIRKNFQAAEKSGDVVGLKIHRQNRFWFVHHLAMGINLCHVSETPAFDYEATLEELMEDALHFAIRGIGLTDAAIKKYYKPKKMKEKMKDLI